ncbi:amidohydrolase family protein [Cytophaga sp. FL35]|uniref:N-acetylglucosamine-6-phosphate deacetylase n=1 Tax=Cytophaga sp. FL35 TaxID=1904456 RepID=UPI0016534264|nr:amidohydrolase family protein [Cytophaga sp. FL35]MBC7000708.1 amidohydrolase family protein [Cytophaga sp. FL35]
MTISGTHYKTGKAIQLQVEDGIIDKVKNLGQESFSNHVCPGFVDLQVNGFMGIDFNSGRLSADEVVSITEHLWHTGVTSYMPTLITNATAHIVQAIEAIVTACERNKLVNASIIGIHLEGPFLSKEDGPRGAHPLEHLKNPDWDLFVKWQELSKNRIKKITLAPELERAIDFIKNSVASGILVSLGHTSASEEQIALAVEAGATMSTHLGNAAHLTLPRHPNYIWSQLSHERLRASIIADGFHLPDSVIKVITKVKPESTILVSDCTKFAGLSAGTYTSHIGGEIELSAEGRLFIKKAPEMLAGSAQSLIWCVNKMIKSHLATVNQAIDMASVKPLEVLGKSAGLEKGKLADLVIFQKEACGIVVLQTYKSGQLVYSKSR